MYVSHHVGLLVEKIDDGMDEQIDGMAADFAMRLNKGSLAASQRGK